MNGKGRWVLVGLLGCMAVASCGGSDDETDATEGAGAGASGASAGASGASGANGTSGKAGSGTGGKGGAAGTAGSGTAGSAGSGTAGSAGSGTAGSAGSGTAGSAGSGTGGSSACSPVEGKGVFQAPNAWTKDVSCGPPAAESSAITSALKTSGGWGGGKMQIDFSIEVLKADGSTPMKAFTKTGDFYEPDCDFVPFPVPAGGALEGEQGYHCAGDGDCHLLVVHEPTKKLYEMWRADIVGSTFHGGCVAVWDLTKTYPANLRGEYCTSADGGGFPITPMLFSADEVAAGEIAHAIRFILPNARIRKHVYVHPGTHSTGPTSGGPNAPPYGVRMRLRGDFPLASLPSDGARVVAKAMQRYGMFLADGGTIALTAQSDRFTQHKWDQVGVTAQSLASLQPEDFEVVDFGDTFSIDGASADCVRNP